MSVSTAKRQREPTGRELVEWTRNDFPGYTPETRAAHTVGIGVTGTFTPSPVIANFWVWSTPRAMDAPHRGAGRRPDRSNHTLAGFVPFDDDLLIQARGAAYRSSCEQRGGSGCPVMHSP